MLNELRIDKEITHKTTVKLQENIELLIGETDFLVKSRLNWFRLQLYG